MPSGKKSRQQRQEAATPPPVRSKGGPGGARKASGRTLAIAGGVIVLVIVAVVLGIVLTQNSSGGNDGTNDSPTIGLAPGTAATGDASTSQLQQATFVDKTLKGIPQNGLVLGNPNAPVTLVEYIDLQCPVCAAFVTQQIPTLIEKYVRPGKLKIKMQPWNILDAPNNSNDSLRGQKITVGASDQNKAFNLTDVLYWNQGPEGTGWLNDAMVSNIAVSVTGLDTQQLVKDANSASTARTIKQIDDYANSRSPSPFSGTPTLLLGKGDAPPKYYYTGLPNLADLEAAIDADLK